MSVKNCVKTVFRVISFYLIITIACHRFLIISRQSESFSHQFIRNCLRWYVSSISDWRNLKSREEAKRRVLIPDYDNISNLEYWSDL